MSNPGSTLNASQEELATFEAAEGGMTQGWTGSFTQLEAHLQNQKP